MQERRSLNTTSFRSSAMTLWGVLFQFEGNVVFAVLPFCILNCFLLGLVEFLEDSCKWRIGFSPNGHGLMTLLVSFLVISKVNLAYERFKLARSLVGSAFLSLRELNQLIATFSNASINGGSAHSVGKQSTGNVFAQDAQSIHRWQTVCAHKTIGIIDQTRMVVQDSHVACYLARNEADGLPDLTKVVDPLTMVQSLRLHIYDGLHLQLLERITLLNKLNEFMQKYNHLLDLASTSIPLSLVQMGRTFLFLWTFTMPLVLREGPFSGVWTAMLFLFFLTYGFVGLELVSIKLAQPFGDSPHDIKVGGLAEAVIAAIRQDLQHEVTATASQKRLFFSQQRGNRPEADQALNAVDLPSSDMSSYQQMPSSTDIPIL